MKIADAAWKQIGKWRNDYMDSGNGRQVKIGKFTLVQLTKESNRVLGQDPFEGQGYWLYVPSKQAKLSYGKRLMAFIEPEFIDDFLDQFLPATGEGQ